MVSERCVSITERLVDAGSPRGARRRRSASGIQSPSCRRRLAHLVAGRRGGVPSPTTTSISSTRSSCVADDRAVHPDLVGLGGDRELVGDADLGHDEAVLRANLRRIMPTRLAISPCGHAESGRKLLARSRARSRSVLSCSLIDARPRRGRAFVLRAAGGVRCVGCVRAAPGRRSRRRRASRRATAKGMSGRPGMTPRMNIRPPATRRARSGRRRAGRAPPSPAGRACRPWRPAGRRPAR